jgi:hypothetical protein
MKHFAMVLCLASLASLPAVEQAQAIDIEDLDEGDARKKAKKAKKTQTKKARVESEEVIREIECGYYVKANAGMGMYFITYGNGQLKGGTSVAVSLGSDFVDRDNISMAWELNISQSVHNGRHWDEQSQLGIPPNRLIQGDTRTFGFTASYELSTYPSRRFGIGLRAGAGVMIAPLLMSKEAFYNEVVTNWGVEPAVHKQAHPVFFAGPTLEYYTKLSHFSIGMDIDMSYAIGFDLGMHATGFMKYTF